MSMSIIWISCDVITARFPIYVLNTAAGESISFLRFAFISHIISHLGACVCRKSFKNPATAAATAMENNNNNMRKDAMTSNGHNLALLLISRNINRSCHKYCVCVGEVIARLLTARSVHAVCAHSFSFSLCYCISLHWLVVRATESAYKDLSWLIQLTLAKEFRYESHYDWMSRGLALSNAHSADERARELKKEPKTINKIKYK